MDTNELELYSDEVLQNLWQVILNSKNTIENKYSLQYVKKELPVNIHTMDTKRIDQKCHEFYKESISQFNLIASNTEGLQEVEIPCEIYFDQTQNSIYFYFLIPTKYEKHFESKSENEWTFESSEMPANRNIQDTVLKSLNEVLD